MQPNRRKRSPTFTSACKAWVAANNSWSSNFNVVSHPVKSDSFMRLSISTVLCALIFSTNVYASGPENVMPAAFAMSQYLPLKVGNQWSYRNQSAATATMTAGSPVILPGGVAAVPVTTIKSSESGFTAVYYTNDSNGLRRHQEYMSNVYVANYGNTSASAIYSPAMQMAPVAPDVGATYPSSGAVSMAYTNVATLNLSYSATTQVLGVETISDYYSSQSWPAVKVIQSVTLSGVVNGQFVSISTASTYWMADGVGIVKFISPNASGAMETWQMTSTNVTPVTGIAAPGAPTSVTAVAGNGQATVTFAAPGSNGGSAVTGYTVTSIPAGGVDTNGGSAALTHVVAGLTNGAVYTFTVKATNAVGTGVASAASNSVTPVAATTYPIVPNQVIEYFHAEFGHYFITGSSDEITKLDAGTFAGWARTGQTFNVFALGAANTSSVCRFFTTAFAPKSSHFYTPFASECADVRTNDDWQFEAEVFAMALPDSSGNCQAGTIPLYRTYNNGQTGAPNHRYTTSSIVRSQMVAQGFLPEGSGAMGVIGCVPR